MLRVGRITMARQQVGHRAGLAPAHRVWLARQTERAGAGFADLTGCEVQVDQSRVLVGTVRRLVETHAVER